MWFRRNYLPNEADWTNWESSPLFAPDSLISKTPKAWIAVAELDVLRDEGIAYGEKLKTNGVSVEVKCYPAAPHPIMAMDGTQSRCLCLVMLNLLHRAVLCSCVGHRVSFLTYFVLSCADVALLYLVRWQSVVSSCQMLQTL